MPSEQPAQETLAALKAERRRERALALRACRPHERAFLRELPKSRYSPYTAGSVLGMSDRTVWKLVNRPRVKRAMETFLQDALDDIGVSNASLVADLLEVKDRCMQHQAVLDREGKPVLVAAGDGSLAAAYAFDARGAVSAIKELAELLKIAPPKRFEFTGANGGPIEALHTHITADMDPEEAARVYQDLMRTH